MTLVKVPKMTRAARRFAELLAELGREEGGERWQTPVAKRLGISQSTVSRSLRGERGVGADAIESAVTVLRLNPQYFFGSRDPESYHEYVTKDPPYQAWRDFLATDAGRRMTLDERRTLAEMRLYGRESTVDLYTAWLLALRGHSTPAQSRGASA